jgi:hypothetical protein
MGMKPKTIISRGIGPARENVPMMIGLAICQWTWAIS